VPGGVFPPSVSIPPSYACARRIASPLKYYFPNAASGWRPAAQRERVYNVQEKKFAKPLTNDEYALSIMNCSARQMLFRVVAVGTPSKV
jgi:hypothetical protein